MRKNLLQLLAAILLLSTIACNKAGKTGLLVPKDAAVVLHINLASLSSKLSWEEIRQSNWFRQLGQESDSPDSLAKALLANPETSGIDMKGDQVVFLKSVGSGGYFAMVGMIKDAKAYGNTITKLSNGSIKVSEKDGLSVGQPSPHSVLVWNTSHFILLGNAPLGQFGGLSRGPSRGKPQLLSADTLQVIAKSILGLEGAELLDSDKRFASLVKEEGDVHCWINSEKIYGSTMSGIMSMMKVNTLWENNIATATLSFDDGKIAVKSNQYFGKEMTGLLKKYEPKNISTEVINRLPSENVLAAGVFNYPPQGLQALLQMAGLDGMVNGFIGGKGYSIEEFVKANKGDIAFALNNFVLRKDSVAYEGAGGKKEFYIHDKPSFQFVAAVSVNDKEAFNKLIGIISGELGKDDLDKALPSIVYKLEDNWFVAGTAEADIASFLKGGNKPVYADKLSGHAGGLFVDIQRMLKIGQTIITEAEAPADDRKEQRLKSLEASIAFWQDAVAYSDVKDGVIVTRFEINLVDKSSNSLKQLNKYLDQLPATMRRDKRSTADSLIDAPNTLAPEPEK